MNRLPKLMRLTLDGQRLATPELASGEQEQWPEADLGRGRRAVFAEKCDSQISTKPSTASRSAFSPSTLPSTQSWLHGSIERSR